MQNEKTFAIRKRGAPVKDTWTMTPENQSVWRSVYLEMEAQPGDDRRRMSFLRARVALFGPHCHLPLIKPSMASGRVIVFPRRRWS